MACNFNCLLEIEGLLKVTSSHIRVVVPQKRFNLETLLLQTTRTRSDMQPIE